MSFINENIENKIQCKKNFKKIMLSDERAVIGFINPFSYEVVANEQDLINGIKYWFCDGSLLVFLTNLRRKVKIERASFDYSSVAHDVFDNAMLNNLRVSFIGADTNEIKEAVRNIELKYENIKVTYYRDGYFGKEYKENIFDEIIKSDADYLIVGMGSPYQEKFAIEALEKCKNLSKVFTCGGFLTQTAIKSDYYHPLVKKLGVRWLQRAIMHSHVRKRLINNYPEFVLKYLLNSKR
ncbi:WecB/TagA/CpsF family glycosyltransferase [uncultured Photobacterium sp.]|uniref:WecB/TagA/CpsF family glycosyltransferase n=1 Tax=uncultured Photobacterium sp. TaxID=173973 RepID=UPI00261B9A88|nr:WecB/TagA/CpsF family glycosyltransferase [uncultured Photobacterium sp.]